MTKPGPGKFEDCESLEVAEKLYEILGNSGQVKDFGSVVEWPWHYIALIHTIDGKSYVTDEDQDGFFTYEEFSDAKEANKTYEQVVANHLLDIEDGTSSYYPFYDEVDAGREV